MIKPIKNNEELDKALKRAYDLIHSSTEPLEPNTPEGDEFEILSILIENYEKKHFPVPSLDPIDAIKFRMDQMNLKQKDIAPIFGEKTRVSEVLNKKRPLTMKMIYNLNHYLGIPFESLMNENSKFYSKFELNTTAKKQLLKNINRSKVYNNELVY